MVAPPENQWQFTMHALQSPVGKKNNTSRSCFHKWACVHSVNNTNCTPRPPAIFSYNTALIVLSQECRGQPSVALANIYPSSFTGHSGATWKSKQQFTMLALQLPVGNKNNTPRSCSCKWLRVHSVNNTNCTPRLLPYIHRHPYCSQPRMPRPNLLPFLPGSASHART